MPFPVASNGSTAGVGNYALDAKFGTAAANLTTFASGGLQASTPQQSYNFYVGESQLFQFLLSADGQGAPAGSTVQMTIKKGKKLLTARNAKLGKKCTFAKTVTLAKSKVGSVKQLAITVRFQGNSLLKPSTKNLSVKIKH